MADERLRELERRAAQGDAAARAQLVREQVRQGRLPRDSFLLTPRERVDAWARAYGIEGLEVRPAEVDRERHAELRPQVDGALDLRWWVSYDAPDGVRILLANLVETLEWADVAMFRILPVARARAFDVVARVYLFAPQRMFQSSACRAALEGATPTHLHLWEVADAAYDRLNDGLDPDAQRRLAEGMQALLFTGFSSDGRDAADAFEASLEGELEHVVRDVRLVNDLGRSHRGLMRQLDQWVNQERLDSAGAVVGIEVNLPVWTTYSSMYGVDRRPELREGPSDPTPRPDPEALFACLSDARQDQDARRDACQRLVALPFAEGRPWNVRALAVAPLSDVVLSKALRWPELWPFFEEVALSPETGRVDYAFCLLRGFGDEFVDPLEAWRRASRRVRGPMGYTQREILRVLPEVYPAVVPRVLEALMEEARSTDWIEGALQGLCSARDPSAKDAALRLCGHPELDVRRAALSYFRACDAPEAVPVLLAALNDPELEAAMAADHGLSGQTSLDADALYAALAACDARAAHEADTRAQTLGIQVLRALERFGRPDDPERVALVLRVAERSPWLSDGAERLVALARHEPSAEEEDAQDPVGETPRASFEVRYAIWRQAGEVARRYARSGHRDPRWDAAVGEAHARYEASTATPGPEVGALYQAVLDQGCEDGLVLYRRAVCALGDPATAIPVLELAAARIPEQYPESPYGAAAWEALGLQHQHAGHDERALEAFERAASGPMVPPKVPGYLEQVSARVAARRADPERLQLFDPEVVPHYPSRWHQETVTAVAIAPDGRGFASADASGWVQVSGCVGDDLIPLVGARVHNPGPVALAWVDGEQLLTAGADGRLVRCSQRERELGGRELCPETLWTHARPLTALAVSGARVFAGDDAGELWSVSGDAAERVPRRATPAAIARLVCDGRWLVAQDADRALEVWSLSDPGSSVWLDPVPSTFVTLHGPGLAIGRGRGRAVTVELPSGREVGPYRLPRPGEPLHVHAAVDGAVVAYPTGPIEVTCGRGLLAIVQTTLQVVDALPSLGVIAYADAQGKLSLTRFEP